MINVQGLNSHPEGPNPDVENSVPRDHAVVGDTGNFAGATGEVLKKVIGTNLHSETEAKASAIKSAPFYSKGTDRPSSSCILQWPIAVRLPSAPMLCKQSCLYPFTLKGGMHHE